MTAAVAERAGMSTEAEKDGRADPPPPKRAAAGLLRLNLFGPGVTETFKQLWRKPESKLGV